jgi:hypothetical protein
VEQVKAMEARASAVGAAGELHYIFPSNGGLNAKDAAAGAHSAKPICLMIMNSLLRV